MPIHPDILTQLATVLTELYPDQGSIRTMIITTGLSLGQITFDSKAFNTWVFVLNEAEAQRRTQAILDQAANQYPAYEPLRAASEAYAAWMAPGRFTAQPARAPQKSTAARNILVVLVSFLMLYILYRVLIPEGSINNPLMALNGTIETTNTVLLPTDVPLPTETVRATNTPDLRPTPTVGPSFGPVVFCLGSEIDQVNERRCKTPRKTFTGQIERIYVSWPYSNVYRGMMAPRKWYWNGTLILSVTGERAKWGDKWRTDGVSEFTFLQANGLDSLGRPKYFPPGSYDFELYIGDKLEQVGSFAIE